MVNKSKQYGIHSSLLYFKAYAKRQLGYQFETVAKLVQLLCQISPQRTWEGLWATCEWLRVPAMYWPVFPHYKAGCFCINEIFGSAA